MTMYLLLLEGDDERRIEIDGGELVLGRETPPEGVAGFVLTDAEASRRHAIIHQLADGEIEIEDLASRNGTFVNGEAVPGRLRLAAGDRITIGETIFEVRSDVTAETLLSKPRDELAETTARRVEASSAMPDAHDTTEVGSVSPAAVGAAEPVTAEVASAAPQGPVLPLRPKP